jgi:predicted ester cyclase
MTTATATQNDLVAVVRRALDEIWTEGRLDKIPELYDESYVRHDWQFPGIAGQAGIEKVLDIFKRGVPDLSIELVEDSVMVGEDRVSAQYTIEGNQTGRLMSIDPTNRGFTVYGQGIWRIQDGRIVEDWHCMDTMTMFQALGVLPEIGEQMEDKPAKVSDIGPTSITVPAAISGNTEVSHRGDLFDNHTVIKGRSVKVEEVVKVVEQNIKFTSPDPAKVRAEFGQPGIAGARGAVEISIIKLDSGEKAKIAGAVEISGVAEIEEIVEIDAIFA